MKSAWNLADFRWNPHEIWWISWNPPDFMNVSFWVITKYRPFFRKTNNECQSCAVPITKKLQSLGFLAYIFYIELLIKPKCQPTYILRPGLYYSLIIKWQDKFHLNIGHNCLAVRVQHNKINVTESNLSRALNLIWSNVNWQK